MSIKFAGLKYIYCRSGNVCEVLIFTRRTNSRIQESCKKYYYNSAAKEKLKFVNSKLREKSQIRNLQKFKHAKITRSTVYVLIQSVQI